MSSSCPGAVCLSVETVKSSPYGEILPPRSGGGGFYRDTAKNVTREVTTDDRADHPPRATLEAWRDRMREIAGQTTDAGAAGLLQKLATDLDAWI